MNKQVPKTISQRMSTIITSNHGGFTVSFSDVIDYKILGNDMQYVEIELDPRESAIAEAGAMMYKALNIEMTTIMSAQL